MVSAGPAERLALAVEKLVGDTDVHGGDARGRDAALGLVLAALALAPLTPAPAMAAQSSTVSVTTLRSRLTAYLGTRSDVAEVTLYDRATGIALTVAPRGNAKIWAMSTVKVAILLTLLQQAGDAHRDLTASERSLATAMIEESDNDAAYALWRSVGGAAAVLGLARRLGAAPLAPPPDPRLWGETSMNSTDEMMIVKALTYGHPALRNADLPFARDLMSHVDPQQRWGVSAGPTGPGVAVELKNGWSSQGYRVHSVGHVSGAGRDYVLTVMTYRNVRPTIAQSFAYGIATDEQVSRIVWSALGSRLVR